MSVCNYEGLISSFLYMKFVDMTNLTTAFFSPNHLCGAVYKIKLTLLLFSKAFINFAVQMQRVLCDLKSLCYKVFSERDIYYIYTHHLFCAFADKCTFLKLIFMSKM